jgi:hypothetical protein
MSSGDILARNDARNNHTFAAFGVPIDVGS